MKRPSPRKSSSSTPQHAGGGSGGGDIEQGGGSSPIAIDPPPAGAYSSPTTSNNTYRSSPRSSPRSPNTNTNDDNNNNNNMNQSPIHKFLTKLLPTLLRDTIYGVSLGLLFLLTLFLLDYHSLISIGSTKAFQSVGMELLGDPEVITAIESSLNVKLMPLDGYTAMKAEITSNLELISSKEDGNGDNEESLLGKYTNQLSELEQEMKNVQIEHTTLTNEINTKLGLDGWCGECKGKWGRCDQRVEYLRSTYGNNVVRSKAELIKEGLCTKK